MSINKICIFFLFAILISCKNSKTNQIARKRNDTTLVIELAIRTAFYHQDLPDMDRLFKRYHSGDSVLFTSGTLPLSLLPRTIDTIRFKVLTKKEISFLIRTENDLNKLPNYLNIGAFEKSDSGYYVRVENLSCMPVFGGGGTIGMDIAKKRDSFMVKRKMSTSIN